MSKTLKLLTVMMTLALLIAPELFAQNRRPSSPPGHAATELGGEWKEVEGRNRYVDGKWVEITYNRPVLRQRENIFGAGEDYGKKVNGGAPVWRLGANQTTRLKTEVALKFGDKVVPAGEYSLFIELKEGTWTMIVSNWAGQKDYDPENKNALWGSYGYTADKDVARAKMEVVHTEYRIDQMTMGFVNVTNTGGSIYVGWDQTTGVVPFSVAK